MRIPENSMILMYDFILRNFDLEMLKRHYRLGIDFSKKGFKVLLVSRPAIATTVYRGRKVRFAISPNSLIIIDYGDDLSNVCNEMYCIKIVENTWVDGFIIMPFVSLTNSKCFLDAIIQDLGFDIKNDWVIKFCCDCSDQEILKMYRGIVAPTEFTTGKEVCGELYFKSPHVIGYGIKDAELCTRIIEKESIKRSDIAKVIAYLDKYPLVIEWIEGKLMLLAEPSSITLNHLYINACVYAASLPPSSPYIRILDTLKT